MDVLYKQINRYGQQELRMNERFYSLPQDKQQRIINAAYKVFALNSYKKAPMSEIANEAEISKALLFHYFRNKKDLYLYLWDNAADLTQKATMQYKTTQTTNFFEMLRRNLLAKCINKLCTRTLYDPDGQPHVRVDVIESVAY